MGLLSDVFINGKKLPLKLMPLGTGDSVCPTTQVKKNITQTTWVYARGRTKSRIGLD